MTPVFLTVADVRGLHAQQITANGGHPGLRAPDRLEAAVAQPCATFDGQFLHGDLFEMGAAYLFHLTSGHAFVDGNKRVGLVSTLVFLARNGIELTDSSEQLYRCTLAVAEGSMGQAEIAALLRELAGS